MAGYGYALIFHRKFQDFQFRYTSQMFMNMHFLFKDYTEKILNYFEERRDANHLSQLLMYPTTANIKQECLNAFTERIKKEEKVEENTLKAFFEVPPAGKNFAYSIERQHPDKFRPLQSLLRREIKNPSPTNVELLAWLIDFKPRPFHAAKKVFEGYNETDKSVQEENEIHIGETKLNKSIIEPESISVNLPVKLSRLTEELEKSQGAFISENSSKLTFLQKFKKAVVVSLIAAGCWGSVYLIRRHEQIWRSSYESMYTGCMYWANDHFEITRCDEGKDGKVLFPLNKSLIRNFQRITREDTITERSIDVVHYISINNKKEYYTTGGNHPVYITRYLRPLSRYIFDKYLAKKKTPDADTLTK